MSTDRDTIDIANTLIRIIKPSDLKSFEKNNATDSGNNTEGLRLVKKIPTIIYIRDLFFFPYATDTKPKTAIIP